MNLVNNTVNQGGLSYAFITGQNVYTKKSKIFDDQANCGGGV